MRGFRAAHEYDREPECCGTCVYHEHEDIDDGWVCVNPASWKCTEWTDYNDHCEEWEGRR